jgi:hydroxyacylglutathione hydrolase
MLLKYFYDDKLAHASYMVGCQVTNEAVIVDPGRDIELYLREAAAQGMRIVGAAETHIHADFVSGARELAERTGATLYVSDEGDADWKYHYLNEYPHQLLRDGDCFMVGNIRMVTMHTPGHTPEHISFVLTDTMGADRPMGIFTGDFVFVGSTGRPDLLEKAAGVKDTAVVGARQLYQSVQRFKELPDYMQVWPAHGAGSACGKGLGAIPSSTVGYEKLFNPMLTIDDEEFFIDMLLEGQPEPPKYFAVMKRVNKEGPAILGGFATPAQLAISQMPDLLASGAMIVDTSAAQAFAQAHIPGTINIPLASLPTWAGWLVDYEKPVYLIIDPARVQEAVRDLAYIGIDKVTGYWADTAVAEWQQSGKSSQSYAVVPATELAQKIFNGEVTVVDVRSQTEWDEGHLPGASHIMLGYLPERAAELVNSDKPIVVQCRSGARSGIGASILQAQGAANVINLAGGIREWAKAGLPIEK